MRITFIMLIQKKKKTFNVENNNHKVSINKYLNKQQAKKQRIQYVSVR